MAYVLIFVHLTLTSTRTGPSQHAESGMPAITSFTAKVGEIFVFLAAKRAYLSFYFGWTYTLIATAVVIVGW